MSRVIACVNEKGGVAKTTTVKNLAIGLAGKGEKDNVIDVICITNFLHKF